MSIRAVVLDCNGVVTGRGEKYASADTILAMDQLLAAGVMIIMDTGRNSSYLLTAFGPRRLTPPFTLAVTENGCVFFDPTNNVAHPLTSLRSPLLDTALFNQEGPDGVTVERIPSKDTFRGVSAISVPVRYAADVDAALAELEAQRPGVTATLTISRNEDNIIFTPQGIDKGSGLREVLSRLGLDSSEVVGIGAGATDVPFLQACGTRILVANADFDAMIPGLADPVIVLAQRAADGLQAVLRAITLGIPLTTLHIPRQAAGSAMDGM